MESFSPVFVDSYDPLKAGSIDGTDEYPHDRAISRAMGCNYKPNKYVKGDPECTLFVGHLNPHTSEETVRKSFRQFGHIKNVRLIKDIVTGFSKCYCFVEYENAHEARSAIRNGYKMTIDEHEVLVEAEKERSLKGWIPRRYGGGLGGKRESGQLRFGGRDRQFRRPIMRPDLDQSGYKMSAEGERSDFSRRNKDKGSRHRSRSREKYRRRER